MKNKLILTTVLSVFALSGVANAQVAASGTMGVTATVTGSLNLIFSSATGGFAVTGTGSSVTLPFGAVQMYGGTVPTGVTRTLTGITAFTLSTPINVEVDMANSPSTAYDLAASLASTDAVNTWSFNGNPVTSTPGPVVTAATYGAPAAYILALTIPATNSTAALSNSINFTATAE